MIPSEEELILREIANHDGQAIGTSFLTLKGKSVMGSGRSTTRIVSESESVSCSVVSKSLWLQWTICSPSGFSIHGILQARILEWVAIPFSRGPSPPKDWTQVSCTAGSCLSYQEGLSPLDPLDLGRAEVWWAKAGRTLLINTLTSGVYFYST